MRQEISVYESNSESDFEEYVNAMLKDGWKISSTSCGFVNSESYDFCSAYHVILVREATNV